MEGADHHIPGVLYRLDARAEPIPLLVDSPHNGTHWPPDFDHIVTEAEMMSSVDAYVDELFSHTPDVGGTLIAALFPRSYVDPNRAEDDLDEKLIDGDWPFPLNPTKKSEFGMGVVRRLILKAKPLYSRPLSVEEVLHRLETYHRPYHSAVGSAFDALHQDHGTVFHINAHSMKPVGNAMNEDEGQSRADVVLGDRDGTSCDRDFTHLVAELFAGKGYSVKVNEPYKGVELVHRYSEPDGGRHSLQVEINRALYLDDKSFERSAGFGALKNDLDEILVGIANWVRDQRPST